MQEGGESCKRRRIGEVSNTNQKRTVAVIDSNRRMTVTQAHKVIAPKEVTGRCARSSAGIMTCSSI